MSPERRSCLLGYWKEATPPQLTSPSDDSSTETPRGGILLLLTGLQTPGPQATQLLSTLRVIPCTYTFVLPVPSPQKPFLHVLPSDYDNPSSGTTKSGKFQSQLLCCTSLLLLRVLLWVPGVHWNKILLGYLWSPNIYHRTWYEVA